MKVELFTEGGHYVETVVLPEALKERMPEGIAWGARIFFRQPDGQYREGVLWQAFTEAQDKINRS